MASVSFTPPGVLPQGAAVLPVESRAVLPTTTAMGDVIADISYTVRTFMPESVPTQLLGLTTGINLFQGFCAAVKASQRFGNARAIGDTDGMVEGGIDTMRGICQSLGGGVFLGYRGVMTALNIQSVNSVRHATAACWHAGSWVVLGKAAAVLGTMGSGLFTGFYVFIAAWGLLGLYRDRQFSAELGACKDLEEMFAFLQSKVIGASEEENKVLQACFSRVTDGGCLEAVKKAVASGLALRLQSEDGATVGAACKEVLELKERITSANRKTQVIHAALLAIGVVGIAISVAGFVTLSPLGGSVVVVATVVLCAMMLAVDADGWTGNLKGGQPGAHDRKYILSYGTLVLVAFVASCALTVGFGLPLAPLIPAGVICLLGLALVKHSLNKLDRKQKLWTEDNPTLQTLFQCLQRQVDVLGENGEIEHEAWNEDARISALFRKLPKADRAALRAQYIAQSGSGNGFKTRDYQILDARGDFGEAYLQAISLQRMQTDHQRLLVAVSQTTQFCWEKWQGAQTEANEQRALKAQALHAQVAKLPTNTTEITESSIAEIRAKIAALRNDAEAYQKLKENIWYVFKLQESKADLREAAQAVSDARAAQAAVPTAATA